MTHNLRKRIAALISIILVISTISGCAKDASAPGESAPPVSIGIKPLETPAQETPAPLPSIPAADWFALLDSELSAALLSGGFSYDPTVLHPSVYAALKPLKPTEFGTLNVENDLILSESCAKWLQTAVDIPREAVSEREQLSLDVMQQYFELSIDMSRFAYQYEPFAPVEGAHMAVLRALEAYLPATEAEIAPYMALLMDVPRYLDSLLAYEQLRAQNGLCMTGSALSLVLDECRNVMRAGRKHPLITGFGAALDGITSLPEEQRKAYKREHETFVTGDLSNAYASLFNGLSALKESCRAEEGLYSLGEDALHYYEVHMQLFAGSLLTADESFELLDAAAYDLFLQLTEQVMFDPKVTDTTKLTLGNEEEDRAFVQDMCALTLGGAPADTAFRLPRCGEAEPPLMPEYDSHALFPGKYASADASILALAQDAFYAYLFERTWMRAQQEQSDCSAVNSIPFAAFAEGYASIGTELMLSAQDRFDRDMCLFRFRDALLINRILPAAVSILVNYKAYDSAQVAQYLAAFGLTDAYYTETMVQMALTRPFAAFSSALGYCQMREIWLSVRQELGEGVHVSRFSEALLELGPCFFEQARERMDVWAVEQSVETAAG